MDIAGILDDVIHQFSDPLAFLRELVQNAIDAGSGEVEVSCELLPGDGGEGVAVVAVRDFGCGMTREIIETRLCRLFSSDKDGDYTKIGRFGIGFLSVFAVAPDFVAVDTGRDGESWRALFLPDHAYELYSIEAPFEGTQVKVVKTMTAEAYVDFERRCRDAVSRWCPHVRTPVLFNGHDVRSPFEIESPVAVRFEEQGTSIVAGLVPERRAHCGFYNRGLALKEGPHSEWPHFAFKIDSRYLEHTLTRDDLLQDQNYRKASDLLGELATKRLPARLLGIIEHAARAGQLEELDALYELMGAMVKLQDRLPSGWSGRKLLPSTAGLVSVESCKQAIPYGALWFARQADELARAVATEGRIVLLSTEAGTLARLLNVRARFVESEFVLAHARSWAGDEPTAALVHGLMAALAARAIEPARVVVGRLGGREGLTAIVCEDPWVPLRRTALRSATLAAMHDATVVLDADDDIYRAARDIAMQAPHHAAALFLAALEPAVAAALAESADARAS